MKELRRILASIILMSATVFVLDAAFGIIMNAFVLRKNSTKSQYVMNENIDADLLIVGSSRAKYHYDTPYITDSLKVSSFNTGQDGRSLTYHDIIIDSYLMHNKPKVIVLELLPEDLSGELNDRINILYPYISNNENIKKIAMDVDKDNAFLLESNFLRHNSQFIGEVKSLKNPFRFANRGYDGLIPKKMIGLKETLNPVKTNVDSLALKSLKDIIMKCNGNNISLIVAISPELYTHDKESPIVEICRNYNVTCIDNRMWRLDMDPQDYFNDNWHMNRIGAREYTKYFMSQIQRYIEYDSIKQ